LKTTRYILTVQADPNDRELARQLLEQSGHHVTACADGPAAVALCARAERPYDAIVIDLVLPGMSGLEVAHLVSATPGGAGAPILGLAASELTERRREALGRWFAACLVAPLARQPLQETVAGLLASDGARQRVG
jgi:CheY-like chemotaxis protein